MPVKAIEKLSRSRFFLLFHDNFSFVIQFSFMPVGTVEEVRLTGSWTSGHVGYFQLMVGSPFRLTGL
jgi:hypothetical protein